MIDFSKFDPWDLWWWKKLHWAINELEQECRREVLALQHHHWISLACYDGPTDEMHDAAKTNAGDALNKFLKSTYPWMADKIGEAGSESENEKILEDYRKRYGRPGEPQYEEMVQKLRAKLRKKLSPMEKRKLRWERERRRRERDLAQGTPA